MLFNQSQENSILTKLFTVQNAGNRIIIWDDDQRKRGVERFSLNQSVGWFRFYEIIIDKFSYFGCARSRRKWALLSTETQSTVCRTFRGEVVL